ncbi:MFS transporter [Psychrobacillus soli]|uniref:MFS transporter n=1 Tax=Psychrobacillus soli TaxID=1543965 RepID=A0A544TDR2_9BACI|nr:MFS transporter [Psychrobacillus soli]TQR15593.1 MFS transporter [Psychrobacillus soli]
MLTAVDLSRKRKFLILIILMMAGASIYSLPYFRFSYYTPLQEALGLVGNNLAYGNLASVYGIVNLICYLPGGWIADKFSTRKLLTFSMVSTGILGLIFATFPPYPVTLAIHALWGLTTVLTFWSVYIKAVNVMSTSEEQGEMFGWLEGGRGVIGIIFTIGGLWLYQLLGAASSDLALVIQIISAFCILTGVLMFFMLPDIASEDNDVGKVTAMQIITVLKVPTTWILAGIIFTTYIFAAGTSYLTPYLEFAFGLTAAMAGTVSAIRGEAAKIISGPLFGSISKKQGKSTGIMKVAFVSLVLLSILLMIIPSNPTFLFLMIFIVIALGFFAFGLRGVYWAVVDELETPKYMVGTVVGVASIIGFIPDAFIYTLFGGIMDANPGLPGFRMIFIIFIGVAVAGAIIAFIADRMIVKIQKKDKTETNNVASMDVTNIQNQIVGGQINE